VGTKHQKWFHFEESVQAALDLEAMPGSGNQWHSPSDGATSGHWTETRWPLMVDCKHTVQKSYSLGRKLLDQWTRTARENGKHFALPIRFETVDDTPMSRSDYVVVPFEDYVELVALVRAGKTETQQMDREDSQFMHRIAQAIGRPEQQRRFLSILAKMGGV